MFSRAGKLRWLAAACAFAQLSLPLQAASPPAGFKDPLDQPAQMVRAPAQRPLMAVASAGEHLIAVGSRGLVIVSKDQGQTWRQAKVPVQSDLLAVHFPAATTGWAVGHDGVVLRSDDSGKSWSKQLDGRTAAEMFRKHYELRVQQGDEAAKRALEQLELNFKAGAALPYLDVWFQDVNVGYAVGSFGMLIRTTDGGKTWLPWLDRIEHDQLNLNSVRGLGSEVFIVGEKGRIYKLDRSRERFVTVDTGYAGSFFGLAGNGNVMLAYGLRGVVYRSENQGRSWEALRMPSEATIAAGVFDPKTANFVLVNSAGQLLSSDAAARQFAAIKAQRPMRLTGVLALPNKGSVITTGFSGVALEALPAVMAK